MKLNVNGRDIDVDVPADTPLLWVVREELNLPAAKFGCGAGLCGACTVHLDGEAVRGCITPVSEAAGRKITTLEGLSGKVAEAITAAWEAIDVPQCGYCQPGQIMQAVALLSRTPKPSDSEVSDAMAGNICRCGTYQRIRAAIAAASAKL